MSVTVTPLPSFRIALSTPSNGRTFMFHASDKDLALLGALRVDVFEWLTTRHAHHQQWLPCGKCNTLVDLKNAPVVAEHIDNACEAIYQPSDWRLDALTVKDDTLTLKWGQQRVAVYLPVDSPEMIQLYLDCWSALMAQVEAHGAPLAALEHSTHTFVIKTISTTGGTLAELQDKLVAFVTEAAGVFSSDRDVRWVRADASLPAHVPPLHDLEMHITVDVFKLTPRAKLMLRRLLYGKPKRFATGPPQMPRTASRQEKPAEAVAASATAEVAASATSSSSTSATAASATAAPTTPRAASAPGALMMNSGV
jgi:hypothetical protein